MTKSFSELRKQSKNISEIAKKLKDADGKKNFDDDRFWRCQTDKAGNGQAVIRFLPEPPNEQDAEVKYYSHGFKGPTGSWLIENCPTTLGLPCPICEDNGHHWNQGDAGAEFVRDRGSKRRQNFVSNILIVSDPANPENEGKVFLFRYGLKIHEKRMNVICPKFEGDEAYLPYDLDEGANFKLRIVKKDGFANFDESQFETRGPISHKVEGKRALAPYTEAEMEEIWKSEHSLMEFLDPEKAFLSYEKLDSRLKRVLGSKPTAHTSLEQSLESLAPSTPKAVDAPVNEEETLDSTELESLDDVEIGDDLDALRDLIKD